MASTYSDKNITNMSQMQLMRFRPEFAIGNDDVGGQVHAIGEIISNSKDELPYVTNGSIELTVFVNSKITDRSGSMAQ
jgi:DNA gyrase/topoisomerase IV subunit B